MNSAANINDAVVLDLGRKLAAPNFLRAEKMQKWRCPDEQINKPTAKTCVRS